MKTESSVVVDQKASADEIGVLKTGNVSAPDGRATPPQNLGGWMARLVFVLRAWFALDRWGLKNGARAAVPDRAMPKPGQQELRLDNVKVCRNDLTDADWDLAQPPKSGARLAFLRNLASTGTSGSRRKQMTARETGAVRP